MKEIILNNDAIALVDDEDFEKIQKSNWHVTPKGYAARGVNMGNGKTKGYIMHREIMGLLHHDGKIVDHINGNKLDNRKSNLRICTNAENKSNCKPYSNNKSGYKGVYKEKKGRKYTAQIRVNGEIFYLGSFLDPKKASAAYLNAAIAMKGDFANAGDGCVILKDKK